MVFSRARDPTVSDASLSDRICFWFPVWDDEASKFNILYLAFDNEQNCKRSYCLASRLA